MVEVEVIMDIYGYKMGMLVCLGNWMGVGIGWMSRTSYGFEMNHPVCIHHCIYHRYIIEIHR